MRRSGILFCAALSLCLVFSGCEKSTDTKLEDISTPVSEISVPENGAGKSAVYVYMCGSTLETKQGAATKNIAEMINAYADENTSVVIQTGGAKKWRDYDIPANAVVRYEIKDGELNEKQRQDNISMGEEQTLSDFIDYCVSEYPAEKTALILWDHGGGALGGVCYDENFGMDCLMPDELVGALSGRHFDLIGFDACMMATNETAAAVKEYADYMLASEEIEPTGGWDYKALIENFSAGKSTEEVGKTVCDSYIEKCSDSVGGDIATLSLFDLREYNGFSKAFDEFAASLSQEINKQYGNFKIVRALETSARFGAGSYDEGASNLIDLYGFAENLSDDSTAAVPLKKAIEQMIVYKVGGRGRNDLGGVSLYFPQRYTAAELTNYLEACSSASYCDYLSEIYSGYHGGKTIFFSDMGSVDESGNFRIQLTEESRKYLKSVQFSLLSFHYGKNISDPSAELLCMGEDNDLDFDWDSLTFTSNFRGIWLALDGVYLNYSVVDSNRDHIIFSAPVNVNGKRSNLRFMFVWDDGYSGGGYYKVIGLWDGLDENNLADKNITPLKEGDKITILRKEIDPEHDCAMSEIPLSEGETVTIGENGGVIDERPLSEQNQYRYVFIADDIFGNRFYSDTASLEMLYTYDELIKNPLPDGECAARITEIVYRNYWYTSD